MIPTIAIVGRPNVGKSTLFNVLTKSREALVANEPGLTRDRKFGLGQFEQWDYWVIDTGGLGNEKEAMGELVAHQTWLAVQEANRVLFLVDGREGLTPTDEYLAHKLRQFNTPLHLVINKTEGLASDLVSIDFQRLGFGQVHTISAAHRRGIEALLREVLATLPPNVKAPPQETDIKVAIVGRPNVGKSTLVNRMLGCERVIVSDQPGTTRDSIAVPFERGGQHYTLVDTAGVRRRAKVHETIEKFSVIKTLQTIDAAQVVLLLLDAQEGMTDQDAHLLGNVLDAGRALVLAVNKWDSLTESQRESVRFNLGRKLHFVDFVKVHFISALHGRGIGNVLASINTAWQAAHQEIHTSRLNRILQKAVVAHSPPLVRGRSIKFRYVHQGRQMPPTFVIHGNQLDAVPEAYQRYLIKTFREAFKLEGTPIRLEFKMGENPFAGRKNVLTPRQQRKKRRLLEYVKRK